MSEFKLRPTPSLIKPILEQLQANGVDINQDTLVLQESLPFVRGRTERSPASSVALFLDNMIMPISAFKSSSGFNPRGPRQDISCADFLKVEGFITVEEVPGQTDKMKLNLAALRQAAESPNPWTRLAAKSASAAAR